MNVDWQRIRLLCPQCGGPLHITELGGVRIWCQRAIGEAYYDRNINHNVFGEEDVHTACEFRKSDPAIWVQVQAWQDKQARREGHYWRVEEVQAA